MGFRSGSDENPSMSSKKIRKAAALRYEQGRDNAPRLTAKGFGLTADRIIDLARSKGIPIEEDPDLVAVLAQLDFYEEIPPELYQAVAEVLAYIYKIKRDREARKKASIALNPR